MRDRLVEAVEKAELAVGSSSGVVAEELLEPVIHLLRTIRMRMSYPEGILVVALAGGTGSGKSSLFNALIGEEAVDVGGIRPTTSHPAASVPRDAGSGFDGFLDHIGVHERHGHDRPSFCIIDLPDTDSVEVDHRHRVDELLPLVDAVVWVTDPEKYRDARLHHDYLEPLSGQAARFIVVLNQMDRLDSGELDMVLNDLGSALEADGIPSEVLLPVAASPPAGPAIGLDALVDRLESMQSGRDVVAEKLLADLAAVMRSLAAGAGEAVDFDARARPAVADAAERLRDGDPDGAASKLTAFFDQVADEVGGSAGQRIARLAGDVASHVERIDSEMRPHPKSRRWFRRLRSQPLDTAVAEAKLNETVVRPARAVLAKRAVALASIADLAVEIESLSRDLSR